MEILVLPQTLTKDILKRVHDHVHCGIMAAQRKLMLKIGGLYIREKYKFIFKSFPQCAKITHFKQRKSTMD